jgi:putative effector of murein hydrolase
MAETTVTVIYAYLFDPSAVATRMTALPFLLAVTTPLALTVATDFTDDNHVTALFVVVGGATVATN